MDERTQALIMAVCSLLGRECYPQDVEFHYQQALDKIANHRKQVFPEPIRPGGLGFRSNDEELITSR